MRRMGVRVTAGRDGQAGAAHAGNFFAARAPGKPSAMPGRSPFLPAKMSLRLRKMSLINLFSSTLEAPVTTIDPGQKTASTNDAASGRTYTRKQVETAFQTATDLVDQLADAGVVDKMTDNALSRLGAGPDYTRDEVVAALNAAADQTAEDSNPEGWETSDTIWTDDVLNLAVNAAGYLLDHPGAGLDEIIPAQYTDVEPDLGELPEGTREPVKGSPDWDAAVVSTVCGWIS